MIYYNIYSFNQYSASLIQQRSAVAYVQTFRRYILEVASFPRRDGVVCTVPGVQIRYFIDSIIGRSLEKLRPQRQKFDARESASARERYTTRSIMKGSSAGHKVSNNSVIVVPLTVKRCGHD